MAEQKPRMPIRRFDVFADYNLIRNEAHGMSEDVAKGRAIWAAKVVAGRRYGSVPGGKPAGERGEGGNQAEPEETEGFRSIGGVEQTDRTFDKEIVDRMGADFYRDVFHPAVEQAFKEGKRYEDIRDEIRKAWK
jgi:hypothetical protein